MSRPDDLIRALDLLPHPEGGWHREVFRSPSTVVPADGRSARGFLTTIYFLLRAGERSRLHRVASDEAWHFYEGDPLALVEAPGDLTSRRVVTLGPVGEGQAPVHVIPAGAWQAARPLGAYTLVGCSVGPGFDFADFEMLEPEVRPISAAETRPLRQRVLRPHQRAEELIFGGDDHPEALHAGAFYRGELIGIASVSPGPRPGHDDPSPWQLRGMAVLPGAQGEGVGRALIEACVAHVTAHAGRTLWCNGRTPALGFYTGLGFTAVGEQFHIPNSGPHYVCVRPLA